MFNFTQYPNLTEAIISDKTTLSTKDFSYMFKNMTNLQTSSIPNSVTNMYDTYCNCYSLTGPAVCGNEVVNMSGAYWNCTNLIGPPVCGDKVVDMSDAYYNCRNLTGAASCGNNVIRMDNAYRNCTNLTTAACGSNVYDMTCAYLNCTNLTTATVVGEKVTRMNEAFGSCKNLAGNMYVYSSNVDNAYACLWNKGSKRLNIYIPANSKSLTYFMNCFNMKGARPNWSEATNYYYNNKYNTYIYPVENVAAAREANGD